MVVPPSVPSVRHNSAPCTPSLAQKYAMFPAATKFVLHRDELVGCPDAGMSGATLPEPSSNHVTEGVLRRRLPPNAAQGVNCRFDATTALPPCAIMTLPFALKYRRFPTATGFAYEVRVSGT